MQAWDEQRYIGLKMQKKKIRSYPKIISKYCQMEEDTNAK